MKRGMREGGTVRRGNCEERDREVLWEKKI